ncbi:hypothetical protein EVAR_76718_1 [Eumeta japonica]|uniref:Uncharacterized protein n=1 Tax=Eumeta variegata TaxID=151549 RepID=A0A4C1SSQ1_EUMVA|nr:hypothetical protein EVAR_76718_1 [Eumeta japonica]
MVWTKPKVSPKERGQTRMSTLTSAFTIVLDDVLRTLEELVSEVRLDQDAEINLPVILSFADDIIIIEHEIKNRSAVPTDNTLPRRVHDRKTMHAPHVERNATADRPFGKFPTVKK